MPAGFAPAYSPRCLTHALPDCHIDSLYPAPIQKPELRSQLTPPHASRPEERGAAGHRAGCGARGGPADARHLPNLVWPRAEADRLRGPDTMPWEGIGS